MIFLKIVRVYFLFFRESFYKNNSNIAIDITFSVNRNLKEKTLDPDLLAEVFDNIDILAKHKDDTNSLVEVTRKEDDDSAIETINLLAPKLSDKVSIILKPRTSVDHKLLLLKMEEKYNSRKKYFN